MRLWFAWSPEKVLYSVKKCVLRIALVHPTVSFKVVDIERFLLVVVIVIIIWALFYCIFGLCSIASWRLYCMVSFSYVAFSYHANAVRINCSAQALPLPLYHYWYAISGLKLPVLYMKLTFPMAFWSFLAMSLVLQTESQWRYAIPLIIIMWLFIYAIYLAFCVYVLQLFKDPSFSETFSQAFQYVCILLDVLWGRSIMPFA